MRAKHTFEKAYHCSCLSYQHNTSCREEGHLFGPIEVTGMTTLEEDLLKDTDVEGIELPRMIIVEVEEATKIGVATEMIIRSDPYYL
jgi:hypothetical protein